MNKMYILILGILLLGMAYVSAEEVSCGDYFVLPESQSVTYGGSILTFDGVSSSSAVLDQDGVYKIINFGSAKVLDTVAVSVDTYYTRTDPTESGLGMTVLCDVSCGSSTFMLVGDSLLYKGKIITLESISSSSAVIDVDGTTKIISKGSSVRFGSFFTGTTITLDNIYKRTDPSEEGVAITVGCSSSLFSTPKVSSKLSLAPAEETSSGVSTGMGVGIIVAILIVGGAFYFFKK